MQESVENAALEQFQQSSSDQSDGVFQVDDPPLLKLKRGKLSKELALIILTAIPYASALILPYFPNALNLFFISKNNDLLDICAVGGFLAAVNLSGGLLISAYNSEVAHCIAKLNEAPNYTFRAPYHKYTTGLYFHRAMVVGTLFMAVWFVLLGYLEPIGQQVFGLAPELSQKIQTYGIYLLPSLYFNFAFDLTRNLLISCDVLTPPVSFLVLTIFLHYLFCALFGIERNFEVQTAAFCKNITDFLNTFLLMLYAWNLKSLNKVWIPWTLNSFRNLVSHIDFYNVFEVWVQLLSLELMGLCAILLGSLKEITAFFLVACIQSMNWAINQGLAQTVGLLVWKSTREGAVNQAKNRAAMGVVISLLVAGTQWLALFALRSIVMEAMLKDDHTRDLFRGYSSLYHLKLFLDAPLLVLLFLLSTLQKHRTSLSLHIMGFYLAAPLISGYLLVSDGDLSLEVLFIGFIIAETGMIAAVGVLLLVTDWKGEINRICLNKLRRNLTKT